MEERLSPSLKHLLEHDAGQHTSRRNLHKSTNARLFNLSLVVAAHVGIAAMLLLAVRELPAVKTPPPTFYIHPIPPPPPPIERVRPLPRSSTQQASSVTPTTPVPPVPTITPEVPGASSQETPLTTGEPIPSWTNMPSTPNGNTGGASTTTPDASVVCSNVAAIQSAMRYPPQARREGLQGEVMLRFILSATGEVKAARVLTSTPSMLNRAALNAVQQFQCAGQGRDIAVDAPFNFRLTD
jgi:periplasmic protein TonB